MLDSQILRLAYVCNAHMRVRTPFFSVQRYCFFLTYTNILQILCHFPSFSYQDCVFFSVCFPRIVCGFFSMSVVLDTISFVSSMTLDTIRRLPFSPLSRGFGGVLESSSSPYHRISPPFAYNPSSFRLYNIYILRIYTFCHLFVQCYTTKNRHMQTYADFSLLY